MPMGTSSITTLAAHLKAGSKEVVLRVVNRIEHAGAAVSEAGENRYQLGTAVRVSGAGDTPIPAAHLEEGFREVQALNRLENAAGVELDRPGSWPVMTCTPGWGMEGTARDWARECPETSGGSAALDRKIE